MEKYMAGELRTTQNKMNAALDISLSNASEIITRDYLSRLETYEIKEPSAEDIDINIAECGKFYKLTKLVINREENFLDKLTTVVNVASSLNCSLATIIRSDGLKVDYYFGIISKRSRGQQEAKIRRREADAAAFKGALAGNLIGSALEEIPADKIGQFRDSILAGEGSCYSAVSGIVALRNETERKIEDYVQGIENLVDSLKDQEYTIVMLADSVDTTEIQVMKQGYETLHTQLSTFAHSSVTINESDTYSLSKAQTDSISEGISRGISMTQSKTRTSGRNYGLNANIGINFGLAAGVGFYFGGNKSTGETSGKTNTTTSMRQSSKAVTDTTSSAQTSGKSLQLNYENRAVKSLLTKIDKHLERLDECESFGAFDCAAYIIAKSRETALTVASNYNALMRGMDSSVQASHINSWHKAEDTKVLGKYLGSMVHPRFWQDKNTGVIVSPASIVSGEELAIQIGLPKKSVSGITVIPMAPFGRNVLDTGKTSIMLGNLYHMGKDDRENGNVQKVNIDVESLSMHTFITGSTGAGKSTTIYSMLDKLMECNVKFLVVEPAKGEYKNRFGSYPDVSVYGTNYKKMPLLRINPFSFPDDIHVLEHIDRLIEIFNVCWPMYAAMPAVLKDAVERSYVVSGWNLATSECKYKNGEGNPLFPCFADVLRQVNIVMEESAYSSDSKGDYKGALCTRLKSLTNGLYGQVFSNKELSPEELFDKNVIVDLSRTGSSETKSLIMGLLVMKLQEYRMSNAVGGNEPLKHVTVLEEAHNILRRTQTAQSSESSNLLGKSVEMLANSIAEMRTYGEGFVIADQAPGLMDMAVIRNTNTKIILRLPDLEDRELVGRAAGLNDDQILELSRLKTFVAAVYQNNWLEPVLCNIDTNFKEVPIFKYELQNMPVKDMNRLLSFMVLPIEMRDKLDNKYVNDMVNDVFEMQISTETKIAFMKYVRASKKKVIQSLREQIIYHLFNSDIAFGMARDKENNIKSWYAYIGSVLEPNITFLPECDQKKIIMILVKARRELNGTTETGELFNRFMNYI
jgi:hypothetical protein